MARTNLPHDLDQRLQVVWQQLGHLIDWCDSSAGWTQLFCAEARPYLETFYLTCLACLPIPPSRMSSLVPPIQ